MLKLGDYVVTGCRPEIGKFGPFNREVTDEDFLKHTNARVTNIKKRKEESREREKERIKSS